VLERASEKRERVGQVKELIRRTRKYEAHGFRFKLTTT